ncbi:MAG: hypothetical protein U9N46_02145, partial [Euryarchaeota archaeon]|nr:hypothetical protein [Euryarchaeota archaeon]
MVSWMYNNAKDVKAEIGNTLRVSLAFLVKLENNNEKDAMAQRTKVSVCISLEFSWFCCFLWSLTVDLAHMEIVGFRSQFLWACTSSEPYMMPPSFS